MRVLKSFCTFCNAKLMDEMDFADQVDLHLPTPVRSSDQATDLCCKYICDLQTVVKLKFSTPYNLPASVGCTQGCNQSLSAKYPILAKLLQKPISTNTAANRNVNTSYFIKRPSDTVGKNSQRRLKRRMKRH